MKEKELTHKIIGCAMKVHSTLGNGFQQVIYQRAMVIEIKKTNSPKCINEKQFIHIIESISYGNL